MTLTQAFQGRRPQLRRAWKNSKEWARGLRALPLLEHFSIQTPDVVVEDVGDEYGEERLVHQWLTGLSRTHTGLMTSNTDHPSLHHIVIRYGSPFGVFSDWSRERGCSHWSRKVHMRVTDDDGGFFVG